jgi:hypothetical protein
MRFELYARELLRVSEGAQRLFFSWRNIRGGGPDDLLHDWLVFKQWTRQGKLSPQAAFDDLRVTLDAPYRTDPPPLMPRELPRLLDDDILRLLVDLLALPYGSGEHPLDRLFDPLKLVRVFALEISTENPTAADCVRQMLEEIRTQPAVAESYRGWDRRFMTCFRPGQQAELQQRLQCTPGLELRWLFVRTQAAPARRLHGRDIVDQYLDFFHIDRMKSHLSSLRHQILDAARQHAKGDTGDGTLASAVSWYGSGHFREALDRLRWSTTTTTLRELGFQPIDSGRQQARPKRTSHNWIEVITIEARKFVGLIKSEQRMVIVAVPSANVPSGAAINPEIAAFLRQTLMEPVLERPAQGFDESRMPILGRVIEKAVLTAFPESAVPVEKLLTLPLALPSTATLLWEHALSHEGAHAAFVLGGLEVPRGPLTVDDSQNPYLIQRVTPASSTTRIEEGPDPATWAAGITPFQT